MYFMEILITYSFSERKYFLKLLENWKVLLYLCGFNKSLNYGKEKSY